MNYKNKFLLSMLLLSFCIIQDCVIAMEPDDDDVAFVTDYFFPLSYNLNLEKDGPGFFKAVKKYKAFDQQAPVKDATTYVACYATMLSTINDFAKVGKKNLENFFSQMKITNLKNFEFFEAMAKNGDYICQTNSDSDSSFFSKHKKVISIGAAGIVGLLSAGGIYYWYYKGDAKKDSSYEETDPLTDFVEE